MTSTVIHRRHNCTLPAFSHRGSDLVPGPVPSVAAQWSCPLRNQPRTSARDRQTKGERESFRPPLSSSTLFDPSDSHIWKKVNKDALVFISLSCPNHAGSELGPSLAASSRSFPSTVDDDDEPDGLRPASAGLAVAQHPAVEPERRESVAEPVAAFAPADGLAATAGSSQLDGRGWSRARSRSAATPSTFDSGRASSPA